MNKQQQLNSEPFVQKSVRKFLKKEGFGVDLTNTDLKEHGVDIKVKHRKCGWYFLVECKGEPGIKVKSPGGWRSSALNSALGQIISRMHTFRKSHYGGYNYGVAFPYSFKKIALDKIPFYVCNRLRLSIFIINENGAVEKFDHRRLKKIQKESR